MPQTYNFEQLLSRLSKEKISYEIIRTKKAILLYIKKKNYRLVFEIPKSLTNKRVFYFDKRWKQLIYFPKHLKSKIKKGVIK
jgi:hypothetical protein